MKLNTSIFISFMYITRTKSTVNLKIIDNMIVSPDTSTVCGQLCWLTGLQSQEASGMKQRLSACCQWRNYWCRMSPERILIRTYRFRTASKTLPPLRIFVSWNQWRPSAEMWRSAELSLIKNGLHHLPAFYRNTSFLMGFCVPRLTPG
jgi:hypothetical protein